MIVLFANFKGGTGKSTIVFNLAVWRLSKGYDVTVCDLDPQGTLTDVAAIRDEDGVEPHLKVVQKLPSKAEADVDWLIDVGMADMKSLRAAVRMADKIVIPVTPSQADIWATQQFLEIVEAECQSSTTPPMMAFVNRADPHPRSRENAETLDALKSINAFKVLSQKLVQRLAFRRSFSEGLAVFEQEPRSKAADELNALAGAVFRKTKQKK